MEETKVLVDEDEHIEIKGVPFDSVSKVLTEHFQKYVSRDWYGVEIVIRRTLPLDSAVTFIERVVESCFKEDGEYDPKMLDIAFRMCTITFYTNIELPSDSADVYDTLYGSTLFDDIIKEVDIEQLDDIKSAIHESIEYRIDIDVDRMRRELEALSGMVQMMGGVFDGVTSDDIKRVSGAITDSGIDTDKLVQSFIDKKYNPVET